MYTNIQPNSPVFPDGWEEVVYLTRELKRFGMVYSTGFEAKSFQAAEGPGFRFFIDRWTMFPNRERIAEYSDMSEAVGMLKLLIGAERDKRLAKDPHGGWK